MVRRELVIPAVLVLAAVQVWAALSAKPVELSYPAAGILVTLPAGYELQYASGEYDVFSAVRRGASREVESAITVGLMPLEAEVTLDKFVDTIMSERALAVRSFESLKDESITLSGLPARWRRIRYTFRGEPTIADRLLAMTGPTASAPAGEPAAGASTSRPTAKAYRLGLVITIEAREGSAAMLEQARLAVQSSLRFSAPRAPSAVPLVLADKQVEPAGLGISLRLPEHWKVQESPGRLQTYQIDYTRGGVPYPMLTISRRAAAADGTGKACVEQALAAARKAFGEQAITVLEQGASQLAGGDGYLAVFTMNREGQRLTCAQWCLVRGGENYTASLTLQDEPAEKVKAMLGSILVTTRFRDSPTSAPTSKAEEP